MGLEKMIHCLDFAWENDNNINPLPDTPSITEPPFYHMILNIFFQARIHAMPFRATVGSFQNTLKALPELGF